jgi:hypothetical protein
MIKVRLLFALIVFCQYPLLAQNKSRREPCEQPATIIVFRPFNFISVGFSYKLFARDSLLGRMNTHDVFVVESYDSIFSLYAATKAPSLNASRKSNYTKVKKIQYPFTIKPGEVYMVRCGFLNQDLFNYPRQPTMRLLKPGEVRKYIKKGFVKRKLRRYLFQKWVDEKMNH